MIYYSIFSYPLTWTEVTSPKSYFLIKCESSHNTVNTRYNRIRYRHSHITGTKIARTNFPLPNRLRHRHYHVTSSPKSRFVPMTNYDVIKYADVTSYWGEIIVSDRSLSPFSAHSIFSTLKLWVASLPKLGNLYQNWSFELVTRSYVICLGLHLYLAL